MSRLHAGCMVLYMPVLLYYYIFIYLCRGGGRTNCTVATCDRRYYGCGTPLPSGITGLRVLDLGCGTGRDCYVAARLVGEDGSVTGKVVNTVTLAQTCADL